MNYFLDNNNGLRNEVTDHSASIKEEFDVQRAWKQTGYAATAA